MRSGYVVEKRARNANAIKANVKPIMLLYVLQFGLPLWKDIHDHTGNGIEV